MDTQEEKQGLYYIIPAKLAEAGDDGKAMLYGLISSLARAEGYCWASNQFLADKLKVTDRTIQNRLVALENDGWILRTFENEETKDGRKLWPQVTAKAMGYAPEADITPHEIDDTPPRNPVRTPPRNELHHSNIKLSNINKDILQAQPADKGGKDDVQKIIEVFYLTINPTINWGNKTNRTAAQYLVKTYGFEKAKHMAEYACHLQQQTDKFAPVITTPYQLKEKLPQLIRYYNQNKNRGKRMEAI